MLQEDLYFPHPIVQDLLWDTLYLLSEPLMTRWPFNKLIRQKALNETMRHIHYEDENSRYVTIGCVEKVSYLNSLLIAIFLLLTCITFELDLAILVYLWIPQFIVSLTFN